MHLKTSKQRILLPNTESFFYDAAYFNSYEKNAFKDFKFKLQKLRKKTLYEKYTIIFLCIGSDRATGDCFGPLVGEALIRKKKEKGPFFPSPKIYGTLESPIHAMNLEKTIFNIYQKYSNPYIIALDASLGLKEHIGCVTFGAGPLFPGIGVKKTLPEIGDIAITGIVNDSAANQKNTLQTTRLFTVSHLADFVSTAIIETFF